jgi:hypothetical protein
MKEARLFIFKRSFINLGLILDFNISVSNMEQLNILNG